MRVESPPIKVMQSLNDPKSETDHPSKGNRPSIWTWMIPLLAGTAVYVAFTESFEPHAGEIIWSEELLEVTPALLIGLLFEGFVLLPLRALFARARIDNPLVFLGVGSLVWLAVSVVILRATNALPSGVLTDASVMLPGLTLVGTFTFLRRQFERR